jgi:hypothetical protein
MEALSLLLAPRVFISESSALKTKRVSASAQASASTTASWRLAVERADQVAASTLSAGIWR